MPAPTRRKRSRLCLFERKSFSLWDKRLSPAYLPLIDRRVRLGSSLRALLLGSPILWLILCDSLRVLKAQRGLTLFVILPGADNYYRYSSLNLTNSRAHLVLSALFFDSRFLGRISGLFIFFLGLSFSRLVYKGFSKLIPKSGGLVLPASQALSLLAPLPMIVSLRFSFLVYPHLILRALNY